MMKNLSIILTVVGASAVAVFSMTAPAQAKNGRIPDILKVPEGNVLLLRAHGRGTQKYACPVSATSNAVPHAILFHGGEGDLVAIHFGGPTWQALDGSSVVGDGAATPAKPGFRHLGDDRGGHDLEGAFEPVPAVMRGVI
jgi:hypothetical protein